MTLCPWCQSSFSPRSSGGKKQRFCKPACRQAYWTAAKKHVDREIHAGRLTIGALKAASDNEHVGGNGSEADPVAQSLTLLRTALQTLETAAPLRRQIA